MARLRRHEERFPLAGHGYGYQAAEVVECIRAGRAESERMPLAATIQVMEVLDRVRAVVFAYEHGIVVAGETD